MFNQRVESKECIIHKDIGETCARCRDLRIMTSESKYAGWANRRDTLYTSIPRYTLSPGPEMALFVGARYSTATDARAVRVLWTNPMVLELLVARMSISLK